MFKRYFVFDSDAKKQEILLNNGMMISWPVATILQVIISSSCTAVSFYGMSKLLIVLILILRAIMWSVGWQAVGSNTSVIFVVSEYRAVNDNPLYFFVSLHHQEEPRAKDSNEGTRERGAPIANWRSNDLRRITSQQQHTELQ